MAKKAALDQLRRISKTRGSGKAPDAAADRRIVPDLPKPEQAD
jgi:hypothetical protein